MILAIGCGMIGMSPSEVYALELREFSAIYEGWQRLREQQSREAWERHRWMACAIIGPWLKGGKSMTEILPLPWDAPPQDAELDYDPEDMEARRKRVEQLMSITNGEE
ncbi:MAG: hypothetical protein J6V26_02645 [Alistipes sp.]|nr:hypothetical protein [Alistipes sp.]